MKYDNLKQVTIDSIRITDGMMAIFPDGEKCPIHAQDLVLKFNGCYASNNSTVAYVLDGQLYVMPYFRSAYEIISRNLKRDYFYVPFSNGDYPDGYKDLWGVLRIRAKCSYKEDFVEDCLDYSCKKNIRSLPKEVLDNCFEIPENGIIVKRYDYTEITSPAITSCSFDSIAADRIGKFCCNNGRVVFVYRNGTTYVAKGYKIIDILKSAGYREDGLFVPFSNNEVIVDSVLREKWDNLKKF